MSETLRIALAQLDFPVGDIEGNVARILAASQRARDELHAHLVVFPELTLTGYPPEDLLYRDELHGRVRQGLDKLRRAISGIDVVVGYPRQSGSALFNAAALLRNGEVVSVYHKHALPNYSVFDEKRYFAPSSGAQSACVEPVGPGIPVAITVCEDVWVPGPVRWAADAGARIVLNLNASPYHKKKGGVREAMVRERVSESGLPIVYVNLVGGQDELVFDGGSFVMDGAGVVTQRAADFAQGLFPVDFEVANVPRPVAAKVERCASVEESVYRAIVLGVRDYIRKNGFAGAVLGLSGGIDSALTAAIAVDAIGPAAVEAVLMPSRFTADMSIEDALAEARALGIAHRIIPIEAPFQAFLDCLNEAFAGMDTDTTEENIQARCRGVILMAISNKLGRILLTTGNKSEMAVGYALCTVIWRGGSRPSRTCPRP